LCGEKCRKISMPQTEKKNFLSKRNNVLPIDLVFKL
jgi:hypothetical protein